MYIIYRNPLTIFKAFFFFADIWDIHNMRMKNRLHFNFVCL